jgi:hypothetical protein
MPFQQPPMISSEIDTENKFRFTLRTMFAMTAAVAVLMWTGMDSIGALLLVGIPLSLIGFGLIGGKKWNLVFYVFLFFWGGWTTFVWYGLPYWRSPVVLPQWAWGVKVSRDPYSPLGVHAFGSRYECCQVRCYATVENCIMAADKIANRYDSCKVAKIDKSNREEIMWNELIDGTTPENPLLSFYSIKNGLRYRFSDAVIWIDTDRGIFYYIGVESISD